MAGKPGEPGINASYVNTSTFTLVGDQTANFEVGGRVWAYGNNDWYGTIISSIFTSVTTITLSSTSDNLDSSLTGVYYGIIGGTNETSSLPVHEHDNTEGSGGQIDHIDLDNIGTNTHDQIDAFIANPSTLTTKGDLVAFDTNTTRLPVGLDDQVLTVDATEPTGVKWANNPAGFTDPMTTPGDIIYKDSGGTTTRLPVGPSGQILKSYGTTINWSPNEADPMTTRGDLVYKDINNDTNRLAVGTAGQVLTSDGTDVSWDDPTGSTDLSEGTVTETTVDVNSSTGANATLLSASTTRAGLLTKVLFDEIAANTAKVTNATHTGEVTGSDALTIADNIIDEANLKLDTGPTNDYILIADDTASGGMKWGVNPPTLPTNLSEDNVTEITVDVTSDTGTNATLNEASTIRAGLLSKSKFDEIEANTAKISYDSTASTKVDFISVTQDVDLDTMESDINTNNAKVTNATHTGEVTGSDALTIADNIVDEANLKLDTIPTNDYILTADSTASGGMKWDVNPPTNLSEGVNTPTTVRVESSTGLGVTLLSGDATRAGLLSSSKYSEIETNTAKQGNATHTGEVTGSDALTISNNVVDEANLKLDDPPINDHVLTADSTKSGGMKWAANPSGFADPMTTRGDLIYKDPTGTTTRIGAGTSGQVLTSDGTDVSWENSASGFADPMTTRGDLIYKDSGGNTTRIGAGLAGQVLKSDGTDISWDDITLEDARSADNILAGDIDFNGYGIIASGSVGFNGGQPLTWNSTERTINVPTGLGPVLQVGQEIYVTVYNDSGATITNGQVVYATGLSGGRITVGLARADVITNMTGGLAIATMDIPNASEGIVTNFGNVGGLDTTVYSNPLLYISATTAGALTDIKPEFPNYAIQVGAVLSTHATTGTIAVEIKGDAHDTLQNFWNGTFRESFDFLVTSDGATVTGSLSPSDSNVDMTMLFSDGFSILPTNPPATITLTPGTDTNPQTNYIYILQSAKVLAVSTAGWPDEEHNRVAEVVLQSATKVQADGALRNQNMNDHIEGVDGQGHLSHIGQKLRSLPADWKSGVLGSSTIVTGSTPDDVFVSVTAGKVMQMHEQIFPAIDTSTTGDLNIVNHPTTPYLDVSNLNTQIVDANNVTLNNTSFSFVLWGVCNKTGEPSHLMINLPIGSYSYISPSLAVTDANNYSVYDIPSQFNGVGFLIARFTYTYKNDEWTLEATEDLRGKIPNTTAGGGGGGGTGVTEFLGLLDTPSAYTGQANKVVSVAAGETALEFTTISALSNVVEDTTPQLGGDLDLNDKYIQLKPIPTADVTGSGDMASMTVDVNAVGIGAALYMAADGNFEEADAGAATTLPCTAMALETSTGTRKVLLKGFMRNDSWNFTSLGQPVYVSTTQGTLTQIAPSATGEFVQIIGIATHADRIFFNPEYTIIEVA